MIKLARISGKVEYREGDGPNITIRPGPCEVEEAGQDASASANPAASRGSCPRSTVTPAHGERAVMHAGPVVDSGSST